jgi:two-component system invasion response regulator UvrY
MLNILVVDDHAIVRQGLRQILADTSDMVVGDEASSGLEALAKIQTGTWDVVVLDLSLPDRSGIEILQAIRSQPAAPPVLVLTVHAEEQYAPRLLRMGASGYVTKKSAPQELVTALRWAAQGKKYISPSLAAHLAAEIGTTAAQPRHATLSDREFQVLCLLASGKAIAEIAQELCVSSTTVSTHRARILEKMRLKSTAELIQYAIWHQLVPWNPEVTIP